MTLPVILGIRCLPAAGSENFIRSVFDEVSCVIQGAVVTVGTKPWNGPELPQDKTIDRIKQVYPETVFIYDAFTDENTQGTALLNSSHEKFPDAKYLLLADTDEVVPINMLESMLDFISNKDIGAVYAQQQVYWGSIYYKLLPDFNVGALTLIDLGVQPRVMKKLRHLSDTIPYAWLDPHDGFTQHYAYVRDDKQILEKINSFSHSKEFNANKWYNNIWLEWKKDHSIKNLHPIEPSIWPSTQLITEKEILASVLKYKDSVPSFI